MSIRNSIGRIYNGDLTFLGINKKLYKKYGSTNSKESKIVNWLLEDNDYFLDDYDVENNSYDMYASDRIGFLKNLVAFGEVISYKGEYLRDMDTETKNVAIKKIIEDLPRLQEPPIAYEVKENHNSIVLCFIIEPVCFYSHFENMVLADWRAAYNLDKEFDIEKAEKEMEEYSETLENQINFGGNFQI